MNMFLRDVLRSGKIKLWLKLKCLRKINSLYPNEVNNHHLANLFLSPLRLSIANGNHEAIHKTKQSFPTNDHATILSLLTYIDFDSVSSHMTWIYF